MIGYTLVDARPHRESYIALFRQYCTELSESDPTLAAYDFTQLAEENLQSPSDHPYLIEAKGKFAGLVVFMDEETPEDDNACYTYIGEIFVLPMYRRHGIAGSIAQTYIAAQSHDVGLCYVRGSAAERFWQKRMAEFGFSYKVFTEDDVRDFLHITRFGQKESR